MKIKDVRQNRIAVTLDKPRHLWYNLNAFALLEEQFGSVKQALEAVSQEKITAIRYFLWAGLVDDDPELTLTDVGRMIDMSNMDEIMNKLTEAMDEHQAPVVEKAGPGAPKTPRQRAAKVTG